jgi:hypothetical protein
MTPGTFASFVDMLGRRFATGLNDTVIYDSNEPVQPDGYLVTATGDRFQTSNSDLLVYVQTP